MMSATSKVWWMLGALGLAVGSVWADPSILRNPPSECGDGPGQTQCNQCDSANAGPQPENVGVGFPGGGANAQGSVVNVKAGASSSTGGMGVPSPALPRPLPVHLLSSFSSSFHLRNYIVDDSAWAVRDKVVEVFI